MFVGKLLNCGSTDAQLWPLCSGTALEIFYLHIVHSHLQMPYIGLSQIFFKEGQKNASPSIGTPFL